MPAHGVHHEPLIDDALAHLAVANQSGRKVRPPVTRRGNDTDTATDVPRAAADGVDAISQREDHATPGLIAEGRHRAIKRLPQGRLAAGPHLLVEHTIEITRVTRE